MRFFLKWGLIFVASFQFLTCVGALNFLVSTEQQLQWAIDNVQPGDEILIANRLIPISDTIKSKRNGTTNQPIIVRGTGPDSELRGNFSRTDRVLINVEHSNWDFSDFTIRGNYLVGILIRTDAADFIENVTIKTVAFLEGQAFNAYGVIPYGLNVLVHDCTFHVQRYGIFVGNFMSEQADQDYLEVVNNRFTVYTTELRNSTGISIRGLGSGFIVDNVFDTMSPSVPWDYFMELQDSRDVIVERNIGTGTRTAGFAVLEDASVVPILEQTYSFISNHCDLRSDTWCIYVDHVILYNQTEMINNSYANGRGLTNVPLRKLK